MNYAIIARLLKHTLVVVSLCLVGSCTSVPNVFCGQTTIIPKFKQEVSLKGSLLPVDSSFLVNNIFARDGMVLVFQDHEADRIFRVMGANGQTLGQFGTRGRADNEFVNVFFFEQYYHNVKGELVIWIGDLSKNKITALNITQSLTKQQIVAESVIETPPAASLANFILNDSSICMLDFVGNNFKMVRRDINSGTTISEINFFDKPAPKGFGQMYLWSRWCLTPDGKYLINAMSSINQINTYSIDNQQKKAVSIYNAPEIELDKVLDPNEELPRMMYYKKVVSDSKYIYALYSGISYAEEYKDKYHSQIHIFDHNLNPIKLIQLDKNVYQITIDDSDLTLYGLTYEGEIWKYSLDVLS